jgi:hypothetical protein
MKNSTRRIASVFTGIVISTTLSAAALAAGNRTALAEARTVSADSDMATQPSQIAIAVPEGTKVNQVLLSWEGESVYPSPGDDRISINGIEVTGRLIEGPTFVFGTGRDRVQASTFQADITSLGMVAAGSNAVTIDGVNFSYGSSKARITVLFDDGSTASETIDPSNS